ncbi:hypothetical protein [Myroides profundi]|uniref:Uncharacterized protein n=1 Tax=Myroides profundi TaxID=480520 RepID=A0AAJ4W345_MYRPR|nr:hypothetical protein [Myroides profundi]AJH16348.1 hypothetical protein MPR_3226 [Myroides profundi]SEQ58635.1 hypothetical protein SAMN04488089_104129 [Myroides profundi]
MNEGYEQITESNIKVLTSMHSGLGLLGTYMNRVSYVTMLLSLGGVGYTLYYMMYKVKSPMFDNPTLDDRLMTEDTCLILTGGCVIFFLINVHLMNSSEKLRKAVDVNNVELLENGLMSVSWSMRIMGIFIMLLVSSFIGWIAYSVVTIDLP